jgi:hypothetical protein
MYPTSGATLRGDINVKVEEAQASDRFFIGQKALPPFGVAAKSGQYPKLDRRYTELLGAGASVRTQTGSYPEVTRAWTSDTYDCIDRGLEEAVDDAVARDLGRFFDVEVTKAKLALRSLMLDHEIRVAAEIMSATNFGAGTDSAVAWTEANIATINFPKDILDAIERVNDNGAEANTILLSSTAFNRIKRSTLLQNFCRGSKASDATLNLTASAVAEAFADNGITQVLIGRARYNSAKKGQAYSATSVWGTTYCWVGEVKEGSLEAGGAGRTLVWNAEGGLFVTESYRNETRRSNMVRVRQNTAEKVIDGSAGTLITTQWS